MTDFFAHFDFVNFVFLGNPVKQWLISLLIIVIGSFALRAIFGWLDKKRQVIPRQNLLAAILDQLFVSTSTILAWVIIIWLGSKGLNLTPDLQKLVTYSALIALLVQVGFWCSSVISCLISRKLEEMREANPASASAYGALSFLAKLTLWIVIVLLALDNLGFDVTTLVAGLGVGSVAIALAVQNILGDVFCSISILLDKPFQVGDFVVVGENRGVVERIGIKSTRLKSIQGEQIIISNSDLLASRIQNFKIMQDRRITLQLGVVYQTSEEKLKLVVEIIQNALEHTPNVRFDRAHFSGFGDFSLNFEAVYFVNSSDYNVYMDAQQNILFYIFKRFKESGIEFAYPTQTLFFQKEQIASL